ncbi:patatin-like phospholipase domain-containing protein 2 [Chanos chanos]|uniref:triacylglycerol lipase n=1 Tax=Chanos chanos TaxID=29144 RepID=A0A6J2WI78_CHACN|nr:patatin-like phospholipase domain-containing protein 2 [Chanos chanos]
MELDKDLNMSFAGCGFMAVYYFGVYCCFLERANNFIDRAAKISGASSGALTSAMIVCRMSPAKCCEHLMEIAKEARKGTLGPARPSFNLLKIVRELLNRDLPENSHLLASGRLHVSVTRVSDRRNVLISEFESKQDLIQALVCSCFFPLFCGVIPPSYQGVRYVDGALSDNLPYSELKNTITISAFSGESDICPRDGPVYFQEVYHNNVSIYVNYDNVFCVASGFFPPEPEIMAEICQNGYRDTLCFLLKNNLIKYSLSAVTLTDMSPTDYEEIKQQTKNTSKRMETQRPLNKQHWPFDDKTVCLLSEPMKKVFCKASEEFRRQFFVVRLVSFILLPCTLPLEAAYVTAQRLGNWISEWLLKLLHWFWEFPHRLCKRTDSKREKAL